jgi:hypothetical protein
MISRRSLFLGSAALLAAPSIVRAASLMPLSVPKLVMPALDGSPVSLLPGSVNYGRSPLVSILDDFRALNAAEKAHFRSLHAVSCSIIEHQ